MTPVTETGISNDMAYTKLHESLVTSTIWREPDHIRIAWITMLALANKHGEVLASIPGLADICRITVEQMEEALECFKNPDPYSRTKDFEGRRVFEIDGGWTLANHPKYRRMASKEDELEKTALRVARHRDRNNPLQGVTVTECNGDVTAEQDIAEADADADADAGTEKRAASPKKSKKPKLTDEQFIAELKADPVYSGIDIDREYGKMVRWCSMKGAKPSQMRLVRWLNKIDVPMGTKPATAVPVIAKVQRFDRARNAEIIGKWQRDMINEGFRRDDVHATAEEIYHTAETDLTYDAVEQMSHSCPLPRQKWRKASSPEFP